MVRLAPLLDGFLKLVTPTNHILTQKYQNHTFLKEMLTKEATPLNEIQSSIMKKLATVEDHKHKTVKTFEIGEVQDMISSFYFLRTIETDTLEQGEDVTLDIFFDSKTFPFKLRFLGD